MWYSAGTMIIFFPDHWTVVLIFWRQIMIFRVHTDLGHLCVMMKIEAHPLLAEGTTSLNIKVILDQSALRCLWKIIRTLPVRIISFLAILGFFYHMFNGIRHMIWDLGYGLEISTSSKLGYLVIFLSLLSTICVSSKLGVLW